tara:strand:+ start:803 stop:1153 length:351 start_codon:yes stop_codon:yes gene_type:complete
VSITITLSNEQAKDLWEALDHLGLDMQCRLPDAETTDPDDMDIAEQCKRTYDISQHVMSLIDAGTNTKEQAHPMQKVLDILSVYREDHICTDEHCEECEAVLHAEREVSDVTSRNS